MHDDYQLILSVKKLLDDIGDYPHLADLTQGDNTSLAVQRTRKGAETVDTTAVTDGLPLYRFDQITLTATASTGYTLGTTINGAAVAMDENNKYVHTVNTGDLDTIAVVTGATANTYDITYMDGETELTLTPATYVFAVGATLPALPAKTGYTADGWYGAANFSGSKITAVSTSEHVDKTFYAKYVLNTFDLTETIATDGGTIAVTVASTPVAAGTDALSYGDEAVITITPAAGFEPNICTMGGTAITLTDTDGVFTATVEVTGDVILTIAASEG